MSASACGQRGSGGGPSMGLTGAQIQALGGAIESAASRSTIASSAPYYSRVFLTADTVEAPVGTFTYTLPQGREVRAFGYAKTDVIEGSAALKATPADTNLMNKGQTLAGQTVLIQGVSILAQGLTDFEFARRAMPEVSASISLNGDNQTMEMGTPLNLPGIGGLNGWGATGVITPPLGSSSDFAKLGSNGLQTSENFRRVPEGLIWRPAGSTDGTLVVKLRVERPIVIVAVARAAAAGIAAFTPPAVLTLDLMVHLICVAVSDGSVNF